MKRLSFTPLTEENKCELVNKIFNGSPEAREIIEGFGDFTEGADIRAAFAEVCGCLAVRIFDMGRYLFPYPFELSERSDIKQAILKIVEYAVFEELPIVFTDVPTEELSVFSDLGFKYIKSVREVPIGFEEVTYRVSLLTECTEISEISSLCSEEIELCALTDEDIPIYAAICRDETVRDIWGYDYREDAPLADDEYFYREAMSEFDRGTAITLGVRLCGELIGEVVFYAFDAMGGADFAFRLLPEHRGRGLGRRLLSMIFEYAELLGLEYLSADVMKKNLASRHIIASEMSLVFEAEKTDRYKKELV